MNIAVQRSLTASASDFTRVVWPAVSKSCGGGLLVPTEAVTTTKMNRALDTLGGVDAWQLMQDGHTMRGIASRVQWAPRSWDSFTIRASTANGGFTEFQKRCVALDDDRGCLFPHLTIQAYVSAPHTGRLIRAAVIRTSDLYDYARPRWISTKPLTNPADGNTFKPFFWDALQRAGYHISIIETP